MQRLKSRERQVPNGFTYRISPINWDSRKVVGLHPSFSTLVNAVIAAVKANPAMASKHKWSTDRTVVENSVETYNVKVCLANGWMDYLTEVGGGGASPFSAAQSLANQKQIAAAVKTVGRLWSGVKTVNEWLDKNLPPVDQDLSEHRATVCSNCPMNAKGNWTEWFTKPAAGAIERQLQKLQERKISTSKDDVLNCCQACLCPLKLMVHVPIDIKLAHMDQETKAALHPSCWVLSEEKPLSSQAG